MAISTDTSHDRLPQTDAQPTTAGATTADPAALGLAAFATTTFVLSVFNAGFLPTSLEPVVLPLALFYGGIAQFLAGMWEFRKGNTFGATAFGSYGTFWMSFAAYVQFVVPELGGTSEAAPATGLFLLAWTVFSVIMLVAALRTNASIVAVFVALIVTLVLLVAAELGGIASLGTLGGDFGILTAVLAWYAAAAVVVNATWGRTVLPVAPRA